MSIEDTDKIDIIATRPGSPVVKLVITDHLPWDDLEMHSLLMQEKINTYLAFVESGQLGRVKDPVIPAEPQVRITLAVQHPPSGEARDFLERVKAFLAGVGVEFEVEARPVRGTT